MKSRTANLAVAQPRHPGLRLRLAAASASIGLSLLLALAACGPGVEGTGTDSVAQAFQAYGASSATVCGAPLAEGLDCPFGQSAEVGTAAVLFLDITPEARMIATYQGQTVTLESRCGGFAFNGQWGAAPAVGARFFGIVSQAGVQETEAASMAVTQDADGRQSVTVRDFAERVLIGPVALARVALPLPLASCR